MRAITPQLHANYAYATLSTFWQQIARQIVGAPELRAHSPGPNQNISDSSKTARPNRSNSMKNILNFFFLVFLFHRKKRTLSPKQLQKKRIQSRLRATFRLSWLDLTWIVGAATSCLPQAAFYAIYGAPRLSNSRLCPDRVCTQNAFSHIRLPASLPASHPLSHSITMECKSDLASQPGQANKLIYVGGKLEAVIAIERYWTFCTRTRTETTFTFNGGKCVFHDPRD